MGKNTGRTTVRLLSGNLIMAATPGLSKAASITKHTVLWSKMLRGPRAATMLTIVRKSGHSPMFSGQELDFNPTSVTLASNGVGYCQMCAKRAVESELN